MNSFDFLRKFYKSSKSAVIICNTAKISYWFNNLTKLGLTEDDITMDAGTEIFGKPIYHLLSGEYTVTIKGRTHTYSVKSLVDRTIEFIVVEIRLESVNSSFINSIDISNIFVENDSLIKNNSRRILSIVENTVDSEPISHEDYGSIVQCTDKMIAANRSFASIVETREDMESVRYSKNNISLLAAQFVRSCTPIFKSKRLEVSLECVEDIYGKVGKASFYNLCAAMINRLVCISDGFIDRFTISLNVLGISVLDLSIFSSSTRNVLRVKDMEVLKERLEKHDAIGTDLFSIKYFCECYDSEASQKLTPTEHIAAINIRIPRCESTGVMLFQELVTDEEIDKNSNLYVDLKECLSHFD